MLEGTTITKEQLETTRLAKYINQLRRKTSNDQLARRSKNLLKKWREMVIPNQNAVQPQPTANVPLSHPSSTISPRSVSNQNANRLAGNTSLSNGGTPTTQHLSTWSPQNVKGGVLSKENMIRRPMPTTPQSSVPHKSSSMPMTTTTTPKFPPPILNTNNGSNSSLATSHASPANVATINSTKVTSRSSSAQPISFANLISQAEGNQHIDGPNKVNPNTNSSNRNINTIDITSNLSQSPKMPKIPRRNNVPGATTIENNRSTSPLFLMGNRTSNFRLPPHNDVDDANSRPSFTNVDHQTKLEQPNNNSRKTFNGFGNMFMSNAKPTVPITSSDIHDSHSDSSSMVMAPVSSASLSTTATTTTAAPASSIEITDSQKHKKRKREEKNKERNSNRRKDVTSLGGTTFDNSISNSSSLGMFNSATNTTNTTNLANIAPSTHKLSELTFSGKFSKSDDAIINIDTTSGSSSPKQMIGDRTGSLMQESPCGSPMLSVENSNESETGDSLLKSSNLSATTTAPIVAVPLDTLDSSRLESSNMPTPKKRGRKKGSTGVDRNMSLAGPSSNQPIFGSVSVLKSKMDSMRSVKKVKTTKELLAELQNRKPTLTGNGSGSTTSSPMLELPIQSLVSPSSLCSDNSQTNSTDMRSTTATPVSLQTAPTPEPHTDSLPNNDQPKKHAVDSKTTEQQKGIDDEIMELKRQLPPINFDAVNDWSDHDADVVCTCKLIELEPPVPNAVLNSFDETTVEGGEKVLQIEVKLTKIDEQLPKVPPDLANATEIGKSIKPPIQVQLQPPRMKSIFDLDFDDDDDPIHRFTTNADDVKVEPVDSAAKFSDPNNSNSMPSSLKESEECNAEKAATDALSIPCLPPPPIPVNEPTICQRYEVVEDALCPAKAHFITSKNCVTQYHVDTLHNCFIPNVNGNWSVIEPDDIKAETTDGHEFEELKFVPKYDHMRLDKIPKNMRDFDIGWYRQRKLRKKVTKTDAVDTQLTDCGNVDQDETEVISSRLSNSSQTNVIEHVTHSDGRDELNCDLKTSCVDDGNVEDVSRINELEAMDGQSEECVASTDSRKRKGSKRKSVKYKIRKSSSDFSRDGAGGPYDGLGDGREPKIEAPTRIILKFSRQLTTDADMEDGEDDDDDDDYDESDEDDDEGGETFDECEDEEEEDEIMEDVEDGSFVRDKDDLLEYNDPSNCHSKFNVNDNIREINIVENNNDDNEKFVRNVDLSTDVMDVDHFKLRRFDEHDSRQSPSPTKCDDHLSSSSHRTPPTLPISQRLPVTNSDEVNDADSNRIDIVTAPQSMDCDDNDDDDDDKTAERLPLENNEQLASFNNVSNENESGIRPTSGQEFKEWHEVVRVRSYNDELLTILPYVVID